MGRWLGQMEVKDIIALAGISVTLAVSCLTLLYSIRSSRRTSFVNTVTVSRLRWIDSLRDKVSEFIAVTTRLLDLKASLDEKNFEPLLLQRDTLLHQIVLHLNPNDPEDQQIKTLVLQVQQLTDERAELGDLLSTLVILRDATGAYLKKEWNRVKRESVRTSF